MRIFLAFIFTLAMTALAEASCECRCVDGEMQALCSSSIDLPPLCPAAVCAIPAPLIAPVAPLRIPPPGATQCSQRQVLNPHTHQYEWRSICD